MPVPVPLQLFSFRLYQGSSAAKRERERERERMNEIIPIGTSDDGRNIHASTAFFFHTGLAPLKSAISTMISTARPWGTYLEILTACQL